MMDNPTRTFDWKRSSTTRKFAGRTKTSRSTRPASSPPTCSVTPAGAAEQLALAEEILCWAEDQFVIWSDPPQLKPRFENLDPKHWILPCSAEQYAMFEPISGSSAFMIVAYVRAFEATGKRLYLAKADALANALTVAHNSTAGVTRRGW